MERSMIVFVRLFARPPLDAVATKGKSEAEAMVTGWFMFARTLIALFP
jgi:hypothetical protein